MEAVKATPRDNSSITRDRSSRAAAEAMLEFGRFRVLLRQRQLIADGVPIELGTRAFDLLLVLLEADGALVTKDELMSRVWPGIVVAEENLKVQIFALRKALGEDRDFVPSSAAATGSLLQFARASPGVPVSARRENGGGRVKGWFPNGSLGDPPHSWSVRGHAGRRL